MELSVEGIEEALGAGRLLGSPVQVYPVAVTTEALALGLARQQGVPEGALVVADVELSARGRRGAPWVSVAGRTLAFSVVLRPELPVEAEGLLWLLAALAAAEGIEQAAGLDVRVKWPNDLLLGGRGLGAVKADAQLGPGRIDSAVLTVRVNVGLRAEEARTDLRMPLTSLAIEGVEVGRIAVLAAVLERLEARYAAPVSDLLDAYRSRCDTLGRQVTALLMPTGEASGLAADVDERGGLVIESARGRSTISVDVLKRLELQ